MYTIKKNKIVITVEKMGKMFQITRETSSQKITTHARRKDIENKINILIKPLKDIESIINL